MTDGAPAVSQPGSIAVIKANEFIEKELSERLRKIENLTKTDAMCLCGPLYPGVDDMVRDLIESRKQDTNHESHKSLTVMLTTSGGQVEPVQRIVETMRFHYDTVDFIVPNQAYSAGTILAMSGDRIFMDYYGRLGPIDPQVRNHHGQFVPALGYLERWNELIEKAQQGQITTPEIQVMLNFDQAELYMFEQARLQSVDLLKDWLTKYKLKSWDVTKTRQESVTDEMKVERAGEIATLLSNHARWHSHGRGLSREVLEREVRIQIDDLALSPDLYEAVKLYNHLMDDFMAVRSAIAVLHVGSCEMMMIA